MSVCGRVVSVQVWWHDRPAGTEAEVSTQLHEQIRFLFEIWHRSVCKYKVVLKISLF
jgi:hypothetical protein